QPARPGRQRHGRRRHPAPAHTHVSRPRLGDRRVLPRGQLGSQVRHVLRHAALCRQRAHSHGAVRLTGSEHFPPQDRPVGRTITDPLVGTIVDGRYEVLSRIARGGMATVYLAVDRRLDREVALKVMHAHLADGADGSDFVARFRREARSAARLTHPGLVGVYDQGVDGEVSYLTMEYVDGVTLRRRLAEAGALSVEESLSITEAVLDALAAAHRHGLVHRDTKPENVLLASDGRVKVADFGLARAVTEVAATTTGTVLGTVAYLSPELVSRGVSDPRTDVYAT